MKTTLKLTAASMKMFVRNKQALFFTIVTPIIIITIFGLIGFDRVSKTDIGIVVDNPNQPTAQFVDSLKKIEILNVHEGTMDAENHELGEGNRAVVLLIPPDFIPANPQDMAESKVAQAFINVGQMQQAQVVLSLLNQILNEMTFSITKTPHLFTVQTQEVNVHNLKYIDFLLPGVVALSIMQMAVFSVAFVFADYREKGILKRLVATPLKPYQFVASNVITRLIVAVAQSAILVLVGVFAFNAHVVGSYVLMLLVAILGGIMFLGLGFTISGFAKTVESVPAFANLIIFPMLFLGGSFFPISSMPDWLQYVAKYLPLSYFSDAMRQVMTKAAGISAIQHDLVGMSIWAVVLITFATYSFRLSEKQAVTLHTPRHVS
jgi:ABC-2 type transport system permease protein